MPSSSDGAPPVAGGRRGIGHGGDRLATVRPISAGPRARRRADRRTSRVPATPGPSDADAGWSARSKYATARSDEALSAATWTHSSSIPASSNCSCAACDAGVSIDPSVASNWKRTRALSSPVMASSASDTPAATASAPTRTIAFSRTPGSGSFSACTTCATSRRSRPSSVQSACRRASADGRAAARAIERRRGVAPLAVHEQALRRAAPPDVAGCRAPRRVAHRWPTPASAAWSCVWRPRPVVATTR